jgi:hypothetical protein
MIVSLNFGLNGMDLTNMQINLEESMDVMRSMVPSGGSTLTINNIREQPE